MFTASLQTATNRAKMTSSSSSIPPWLIFFLLSVTCASCQDGRKSPPRCPPGTLNDGWFIQRSYAFTDPLDCCDRRVKLWQAFDDYETPYTETGCTLVSWIQGEELSRFIAPVRCSNSSTCGDQDFFGNKMQCCPTNDLAGGFCAAVPASGESRCDKVAELIQWYDEKDEEEHHAEQEFSTFASECYAAHPNNSVCLACSTQCPDGFKLSPKPVKAATKAIVKEAVKNVTSRK